MSACAFDLDHYRELLDAASAGGYRWATFDAEPQRGDLFLRHDIDLSLEAALELARLEQSVGARATYFLMTESAFYNLDSHSATRRCTSCATSVTPSGSTPSIRMRRATSGSTPSSRGTTPSPRTCTSR